MSVSACEVFEATMDRAMEVYDRVMSDLERDMDPLEYEAMLEKSMKWEFWRGSIHKITGVDVGRLEDSTDPK
jgi:hypothetical protein